METENKAQSSVLLDAAERPRVAGPLLPEFAIVATLVLIAAPVVLVGATAIKALSKRVRTGLR